MQSSAQPPAPAGPPPPPPGAPGPILPTPHQRRGPWPIVALVVAGLLAAVLGAVGVVLLLGEDDPGSDRVSARDDSADARADTDADEADEAEDSQEPPTADEPTDPPTSQQAAPVPAFRCWDGTEVVRRRACPEPTGPAGMAWAFPSSSDNSCITTSSARRPTEVDCNPLVDGVPVRVHYSEWSSRIAMESYYGNLAVEPAPAPGGRGDITAMHVYSRDSDVGFKVALYFSDPSTRWSVTIYAADESAYLRALSQVDIRASRQLRGRPL